MSIEKKCFLKRVSQCWRREFPLLRTVDLQEVPKVPKGCNFMYTGGSGILGYFYFVRFNFSVKRRGEFSIGLAISQSGTQSTLDPAKGPPSATSIGSFGIWQFMSRPYYAWGLVDTEAECKAVLGFSTGLSDNPDIWRPSTYNQPLEKIVDEAIIDVNQTLRTFVFPVMQIEV